MKICWDNLEKIYFTKAGTFRSLDSKTEYVEKESCKNCGISYLAQKRGIGLFCSYSCSKSGKNPPMYGKKNPGFLNGRNKSIARALGLASYDVYKDNLGIYEDIRKQANTEILEVRCAYCGAWYPPTYESVSSRFKAINGLNKGEQRFYCSENCKQSCPTYRKKIYPEGFKQATSREVSTYLRQMVFERDGWECQKCSKTIEEAQLHCHHMDSVAQNPIFQNDMDSCITLCKDCHKMVHKQYGCRYVDLRCKKEE